MNGIRELSVSRYDIRRFGSGELGYAARGELAEVTARLLASSPASVAEFERYVAVRQRQIALPREQLYDRLAGRTVLVTGDTGCIGAALIDQLARFGVRHVAGVSLAPPDRLPPGNSPAQYGRRQGEPRGSMATLTRPDVSSIRLNIRDGTALQALIEEIAPDMVFHLAAQRDPGLAERSIQQTITTNTLGTRNVVEACKVAGVTHLVYASTGKALRPYTTHVYAASKRVGERIVADATVRGQLHCSAARFTHVVDNAILLDRLRRWAREADLVRIHSLDAAFYVQSAVESAQLLLVSALAPPDGVFRVHAIRDLDWPVNLLDLALGAIAESGNLVPVQEIGYEPGYEREPYPGLYDPCHSGAVSPLLNAMEAPTVEVAASPDVDAACGQRTLTPELRERIDRVERLAAAGVAVQDLHSAFDDLVRADLRQTICETPPDVLRRIVRLTAPYRLTMADEHRRIDDAIRQHLAPVGVHD